MESKALSYRIITDKISNFERIVLNWSYNEEFTTNTNSIDGRCEFQDRLNSSEDYLRHYKNPLG